MSHRRNSGNAAAAAGQEANLGSSHPNFDSKDALEQRNSIVGKHFAPEAIGIMRRYFTMLNARNLKGIAELCQFPFVSFEEVSPVVVKCADDLISHAPPSINMSEDPKSWADHHSFIQRGSYDKIYGVEILAQDRYAVNLSMVYNRYGSEGKMLLQCEGVYCVICKDGHWGIELMSTIFTPVPLVGWHYPETEEAAVQVRLTHDFEPVASTAGINIRQSGGNPNDPADIAKCRDDWQWYRAIFERMEPGRRGSAIGVMPYSRVIHATVDKAHVFSGLTRYNTFGEELDTSSEMSIVTWSRGRWGKAGAGAYITMRDHVGDPNLL